MTDLITDGAGPPRRRPRLRQARRDPCARPGRRRRRPRDGRRPAGRGRARPRGDVARPACPAASPSRTAAPPASTSRRSPSPGSTPKVDFGAKDGPADLAFLIAAPAGGDATHLQLLTKLARALVKPAFTDALRDAETPEQIVDEVHLALGIAAGPTAALRLPPPLQRCCAAPPPRAPRPRRAAGGRRRLVAVTACPTGIAHTYMAAEALEAAAERAGVDIQVETQGSAGSTPLAHEHDRRGRRRDLRRRRRGP